ncbi:hypothetical protein [Tsukamurella pseudospumae]|uniref:Uncharacterized protein n=1 Tax=Tsukamurella pseudospumae TaxID=239498 RepID=A0A137ZQV1_9ACTN|nr:hypothetical protein [Tsukamurella pseudospumae]KXP00535.1 hypothetical protein AXK61_15200 [Tsukamurella pseudospumae]
MTALPAPQLIDATGISVPLSRDRVTTIGRDADLSYSENQFLHRRAAAVYWSDGAWWLRNTGEWIPIRYEHRDDPLGNVLSVGQATRITRVETLVVIRAGKIEHRLMIRIPDVQTGTSSVELPPLPVGIETLGPGSLTIEQLQLLVALCEPILRQPGTGMAQIVSTKDAACRLDWSVKKLERKIDNLCVKLTTAGVPGLAPGPSASNRRVVLCEWALASRIVSRDSLRLLP